MDTLFATNDLGKLFKSGIGASIIIGFIVSLGLCTVTILVSDLGWMLCTTYIQ